MQARIRQYIFQRTQMLAAITHDLQTPLTRMRLRLEKVSEPELQERLIGDLSAMQAMVREGLDLARSMDTNEAMQMLDLDSLLDSVVADAAESCQRVTLSGHAGMALLGRPMDLRRCLVNLIDNAIDAVDGHGTITIRTARAGDAISVSVIDDGPGVPAELQSRLFEPFFTTKDVGGGTGLGLDIVRRIVENHRGQVRLESAPGRTRFEVRLPVTA